MELRDLLIAAAFLTSSSLAQTCYFPDGTVSPSDKPCNSGGSHSACCGMQSDGSPAWCLTDGLCFADMKPSRGSCTDKSWNDPACAKDCKDNSPHGGWQLFSCPEPGMFSCSDCSSSNSSVFPIPPSSLRLNAAQASSMGIPLPTQTVTPSGSNASSATASGSSTAPPAACETSSGLSAPVTGAIVGACVGAALLLFAALFGWEKHKNRRLSAQLRNHENWYKGWSPNDAATVAGIGTRFPSAPRMHSPPPPPPPPPPPAGDHKDYGHLDYGLKEHGHKEYRPGDHTSLSRREFYARDAKVPVPRHARHEMDAGGHVAQELHSPSEEDSLGKLE